MQIKEKKRSGEQHEAVAQIMINVMKIIQAEGKCEEIEHLGPVIRWAGNGVSIMLRPSFLGGSFGPSQGGLRLPGLGIDICDEVEGKVFNVEFNLNQEIVLVSFKRGEWEKKIENIAQMLRAEHPAMLH